MLIGQSAFGPKADLVTCGIGNLETVEGPRKRAVAFVVCRYLSPSLSNPERP